MLYINHADDVRVTCGDNKFSTHSSQYKGLSPKITAIKAAHLGIVDVLNYQVIGIDETQFYDDLVPNVDRWVNEMHKVVICAGLDGDFRRKPFGDTLRLIPLADKVTKLTAVCHQCLIASMKKTTEIPHTPAVVKAPFTACIVQNSGDSIKKIGGVETYSSVCRYHYGLHMNSR